MPLLTESIKDALQQQLMNATSQLEATRKQLNVHENSAVLKRKEIEELENDILLINDLLRTTTERVAASKKDIVVEEPVVKGKA